MRPEYYPRANSFGIYGLPSPGESGSKPVRMAASAQPLFGSSSSGSSGASDFKDPGYRFIRFLITYLQEHPGETAEAGLGRSVVNEFQILNPLVSRLHLRFRRKADGQITVQDQGTKNGTALFKMCKGDLFPYETQILNGPKVGTGDRARYSRGKEQPVQNGDILNFVGEMFEINGIKGGVRESTIFRRRTADELKAIAQSQVEEQVREFRSFDPAKEGSSIPQMSAKVALFQNPRFLMQLGHKLHALYKLPELQAGAEVLEVLSAASEASKKINRSPEPEKKWAANTFVPAKEDDAKKLKDDMLGSIPGTIGRIGDSEFRRRMEEFKRRMDNEDKQT